MPILFFQGEEIMQYNKYAAILSGPGRLHLHGGLFRVLNDPTSFPPTIFAVAENKHGSPFSLVSITSNPPKGTSLICDPSFSAHSNPYVFPNHEIMAFTAPEFREKGKTKKLIKKLIQHRKVDKNDQIYVYSKRMKRIVSSFGHKTINLHEFTA